MQPIISIENLSKTYASGFEALRHVDLEIRPGEIFALLGPNGAGKTTLINIICGIVTASEGRVLVFNTVSFSRGLWSKAPDPAFIEKLLKDLSLFDKRDNKNMTLSGGMKRRVLIAKALAHEPTVLFLDEPTAGVDVELRQDMWELVRGLRASGVTIILTTHYIEEAEEMADRIGIINRGEIILVEETTALMQKLGKKELTLHLHERLNALPKSLNRHRLTLAADGNELIYTYDSQKDRTGITALLKDLADAGVRFKDLHTTQSSLEDIFVDLVRQKR